MGISGIGQTNQRVNDMTTNNSEPRDSDNVHRVIRSIVDGISAIQTEAAGPKQMDPEKTKDVDYTPTERALYEMLGENTGTHMLDSGGAYGRGWQRIRAGVRDLRETPIVTVDINYDGESFSLERSLFRFLAENLGLTDDALALQEIYDQFVKDSTDPHLVDMEAFADEMLAINYAIEQGEYFTTGKACNTYGNSALDGVIQFVLINTEDETFILLQTHNGCDIRWGYSTPRVFEVSEEFAFMDDFHAKCPVCEARWYSDDCGHHWYNDEMKGGDMETVCDKDLGEVYHKGCQGEETPMEFW